MSTTATSPAQPHMSELAELLERFRRGGELVASAVARAADPELDFHQDAEAWSVRQIVNHLRDWETVGVERFRRVIAEDNPTIAKYDQEAWATRLDYARRSFARSLETYVFMRDENYALLKDLPETIFARPFTHSVRGSQVLLDLLRSYAEHAEVHAQQIGATREAFRRAHVSA
jgi:hypothetical protein